MKLKYQTQLGMKNLNYPVGHILHQILKIILSISSKMEAVLDNPSITMYIIK